MALTIGSKAPAFKLASSEGGEVSLAGLRGTRFVLYFYPRDNTPGCTQEACDFRDHFAKLKKAGVPVYGVSKDTVKVHDGFRAKYRLPFPLLSDPDNAVSTAYGAFGKKMMYGKEVQGTIRSTFLIGADGKVEQAWSPVKVKGHVEAVLAALGGAPTVPAKKQAVRKS